MMKSKVVPLVHTILAAGLVLFAACAHAQVFKCKNSSGAMEYSDRPCANAKTINIDKEPEIAPPSGGRVDTPDARALRMIEAERRRKNPPLECQFRAYAYGDNKGQLLAKKAQQECLQNIELKEQGRNSEVSMESYQMWKDNHQMMQSNRNAPIR